MGSMRKVIGFSVPPAIEREVGQVAKAEQRTKSELFREMFRVYKRFRIQREQEEERWVLTLIREAQDEERQHPLTPEEIRTEDEELNRYGEAQSKKLGIKEKDITRLLHEYRTRRRA